MGLELLKETLRDAPVVDRHGYDYFVHPATDCLPQVEPALLEEIVAEIRRVADVEAAEKIFTVEAMGIHHATALSLETGLPFVVARKRAYGFDGEVAVHQLTGYSGSDLYVNNVEAGDRLLVVDDVLATGGTLRAVGEALEEIGAEIVDAVVVIHKRLAETEDLPFEVTGLVEVEVVDGEVVVLD